MEEQAGATPVLGYRTAPLPEARALRAAWLALSLLLAINLFNYIDRYVLSAVLHRIGDDFFPHGAHAIDEKLGWLASAFLICYMCVSPLFGWLGDRAPRWKLIGIGVILWSLASGASGLATFYTMMLVTRLFVGVGEAAYGPVAPTIIADLFPVSARGKVLAWFYAAIPVGGALGYGLGLLVAGTRLGWHGAFLLVVPPGLLLARSAFSCPKRRAAKMKAPGITRGSPTIFLCSAFPPTSSIRSAVPP